MTALEMWDAAERMSCNGGQFVQALALAIRTADADNMERIEKAFPEIMAKYGPDGPFAKQTQSNQSNP